MTRVLLIIVAVATGLAFAAAAPAAALAGPDTVPAVAQPAGASTCTAQKLDRVAVFAFVTCKKKAQPAMATPCQQFLGTIPVAEPGNSGAVAHPEPGSGMMHVAAAEQEGPTEPPRG